MIEQLATIGVRRYGEEEVTPVVLNGREACGTVRDHIRRGCVGIEIQRGSFRGLVHLTTEEVLRLADLLRAMADTNQSGEGKP